MSVFVTRIVNASVLLEFETGAVLTDPYFRDHWFMPFQERIGMRPDELPRLAAIIGSHSVFDHWQPSSLDGYPYKAETPVYVATESMRSRATRAGFPRAEVLDWGHAREIAPGLTLASVEAQRVMGLKASNYVLSTPRERVFFGGEARDLDPLRRFRRDAPPVDIALLPINGAKLLGQPLVTNPEQALEASLILGATTLVPIHYSHRPIPPLLLTPGSGRRLMALASLAPELRIAWLETGERRDIGTHQK